MTKTTGCDQLLEDQLPEEQLLGQFIPLHYHFQMLRDESRMAPFRAAIEHVVPEGGVVLELGGGTGVLSWFAAQRARQVYCVERNPALARAARTFLARNPGGERVTVVQADALEYLPPEPVDVVICEMLHVGLIREKQLSVIASFQERYRARFGPKLPRFLPDTTLLGLQPSMQDFDFLGYRAEVPFFTPPGSDQRARALAAPTIYATIDYGQPLPSQFDGETHVAIERAGTFNAVTFITNNFLAFHLEERRAFEWLMNLLVLPLPEPLEVVPGDHVAIGWRYAAGGPLESLYESLRVTRISQSLEGAKLAGIRRAA